MKTRKRFTCILLLLFTVAGFQLSAQDTTVVVGLYNQGLDTAVVIDVSRYNVDTTEIINPPAPVPAPDNTLADNGQSYDTTIIITNVNGKYDTTIVIGNYKTRPKDHVEVRPFQISFITPIGTNGLESGRVTNMFSINIFAGYSGGLDGVEFGAFSNVINGKMNGVQFSGFTNIVSGKASGAQFAGFTNIVKDGITGGQFTGFSNISGGPTQGIQLSGFSNVSKGDLKMVQITGFSNVVNGSTDGLQVAGFSNVTRRYLKGLQLAGFSNVAGDNADAVQIAGFSNNVKDTLTGFQLSGFINTAKHVKGCQLGFINICDSIENGIPIGFISIVRKGYHEFEIGGGESYYAYASLKLGVPKFYNIFSVGIKPVSGDILWGPGYGVGTELQVTTKFKLNLDLMSYHVFDEDYNWTHPDWDAEDWENQDWDYEYSSLNTLSATLTWQIAKNIALFGGPAFNVTLSNETNELGELTGSKIAPYTIYSDVYRNTLIEMYPGFRAGFRF